MDQSRALNALAQYVALAKSATSPQAAANLVTRATSDPNTYVFAELVQQKNIQALKGNAEYGTHYELLGIFAWGTWEGYRATQGLPQLNDAQALKLRLLSLLTIGAEKPTTPSADSNLSYASLCARLDLASPVDLEHLVTQAIYSNLLTAMLNPANQTVVVTSVAPLRDIAPGSIASMMSELEAWSSRCEAVLRELEVELTRVKEDASKRATREAKAERQIRAANEAGEKSGGNAGGGVLGTSRGGNNLRSTKAKDGEDEEDDDYDAMDVDGPGGSRGGRKKGGPGLGGLMGKLGGGKSGAGR